jgi:hypothetical protein
MTNTMADYLHKHETGEMHNSSVISFDLQQAMPVPKLTVSTTLYKRSRWV